MKPYGVTIQIKPLWQYFCMVLFFYKMNLDFSFNFDFWQSLGLKRQVVGCFWDPVSYLHFDAYVKMNFNNNTLTKIGPILCLFFLYFTSYFFPINSLFFHYFW